MSENDDIINQNILSRDLLIEVILTAVIISFGLNVFVASFSNIGEFNSLMFIIGIAVVLISLATLIYKNFKKFDRTINIIGFFIYDAKDNKLVDVPKYRLSNELVQNLRSAFREDKSLKDIWDTAPLRDYIEYSNVEEKYYSNSIEIIEELFEYFIFHQLSLTLESFFGADVTEKDLDEYGRDDIPDTLLNNRFLNLFSKPIEEREAFLEDMEDLEGDGVFLEQGDEKTLYVRMGRDGTLYQRLHLILPEGTNVKRHSPNRIVLESDQILLNFDIIFDGFNLNLPEYFQKYYLDLKNEFISIDESLDILRFQVFKLELKIGVTFKIKSLFSNSVWKYSKWLDLYVNSLNNEMSMDTFFESIQWEQMKSILYMIERTNLIDKIKIKNVKNE